MTKFRLGIRVAQLFGRLFTTSFVVDGQLELERRVIRREIFRFEGGVGAKGKKNRKRTEGKTSWLLQESRWQSEKSRGYVVGTYKSLPGFGGPFAGTAVTRYPNDV